MEAVGLVLFSASFGVAVAPKSGAVSMVTVLVWKVSPSGWPLFLNALLKVVMKRFVLGFWDTW